MLLPLLNVSVPDYFASTPNDIMPTALKFDLWMLPAHMIFELIPPPEALEASSGTSLSKTVVGSGTALVRLEMAGKVGFPEECLVAVFNTALVSCIRLGPCNSGWWFAIGPVLKDQSLLGIWFRRMQHIAGHSRLALRQSLVANHQQRHHGLCISLLFLCLTALPASGRSDVLSSPILKTLEKKNPRGYLDPIRVACRYTVSCMASIDLSQLIGYPSGWEVESSIFVGADELAGKAGKLGRPINDG